MRGSWRGSCRKTYGLLGFGAILTVGGAVGTALFLRDIQTGKRIPPAQIAARLILPHVALLAGLGLLLAAVILLRKHIVIRSRLPKDDYKA
jgi:hypothetical protein